MDYFSCSEKKGKRDKKQTIVKRLFSRKPRKEDVRSSKLQQSNNPKEELDEGAWRRLKDMEQSRQISAMKNHIEQLEGQLNGSHSGNKKAKHKIKKPVIKSKSAKKNRDDNDGPPKGHERRVDLVDKACKLDGKHEEGEEMLKNIVERIRRPSRKLSDSATEAFVCVDQDFGDDGGPSVGKLDDIPVKDANAGEKESKSRKISKRIFKRRSAGVNTIDENAEFAWQKEALQNAEHEKSGNGEAVVKDFDETGRECVIDGPDESNEKQQEEEHGSQVKVDVNEGCVKKSKEFLVNNNELSPEKQESCLEISSHKENDQASAKITETRGQNDSEIVTLDRISELESANKELEKNVSILEEQLWLADEDKQNMQGMLERQKDKAIKNLACKFEEINKKTLCEFKGIFERKLQEINDEKVALQEKLEKLEDEKRDRDLKQSEVFDEKQTSGEKKITELEEQNVALQQRCRKLSANLGQLKKQNDEAVSEGRFNTVGLADATTQTDLAHSESEKNEIKIIVADSLQCSLNDIQADVKNLANSVLSLSENFQNNSQSWASDSVKNNEELGDSFRSDSVTTEKDLEDDSIELASPRTEGNLVGDSDLPKNEKFPVIDKSNRSNLASPITENLSIDENLRLTSPNSFLVNPSLVNEDLCLESDDKQTEGALCSENAHNIELLSHNDKENKNENHSANPSIDDGDSGIFGSEYTQITDSEIESQLHGIEDKYRKITQEFKLFEYLRIQEKIDDTKQEIQKIEFDPEVQRIIDEVNMQYNEYFYANKP